VVERKIQWVKFLDMDLYEAMCVNYCPNYLRELNGSAVERDYSLTNSLTSKESLS